MAVDNSVSIPTSKQLAIDLYEAIVDGDVSTVSGLLDQGADPNNELYWSNEWGWKSPPLHSACEKERFDIAKLLVEKGNANPNRVAQFDQTPLLTACLIGHKQAVQYLVEDAKCDIDLKDKNGRSPFDLALVDVDADNCDGQLSIAVYLINQGCSCDDEDKATLLRKACQWGILDIVKELVEKHECDPKDELLELALKDLYVKDDIEEDIRLVNIGYYLINRGCGNDQGKANLLWGACYSGNLDMVKELVEIHKCDPDAVDDIQWAPLHHACSEEHKDIVIYLVEEAKCDINVRDCENETPLHSACFGGHKDIVVYLVEEGKCDTNVKGDKNYTPLHYACIRGHKDVVSYLVEEVRCDINVKNRGEETPLHLACASGHKDVVSYLVEEAKCDISTRNIDGKTPFQVARPTVVKYLKTLQQKSNAPGSSSSSRKKPRKDSTSATVPPAKRINISTGPKLSTHRICSNCNSHCHIRFSRCPTCENEFPACSKSRAKGGPKKNPANLLQILQKKVDQLQQSGYDVVVLVHKSNEPGKSRHLYRKYCTSGCAEKYLESPLVYSSWKDHCSKNSIPTATASHPPVTSETQHSRTRQTHAVPSTSDGAQKQLHDIHSTSHDMPSRSLDCRSTIQCNDHSIVQVNRCLSPDLRQHSQGTLQTTSHATQQTLQTTQGTSHATPGATHDIQALPHSNAQPTLGFQNPPHLLSSLSQSSHYPVQNMISISRVPFSMPYPTYHPSVFSPIVRGPMVTQSQQLPSLPYSHNHVHMSGIFNAQGHNIRNPGNHEHQNSDYEQT